MKKGFCFLISCLFPFFTFAQEMWGISNSNFSGAMGMSLNPSVMVAAPYTIEINIFSFDAFLQNNYIIIRKNSRILAKSTRGEQIEDDRITDLYLSKLKNGYASALINGPGLIVNRGNRALGFSTGFRTNFSAKDLPAALAKFMYDGFDFSPQHGINYQSGVFKVALLSWAEAGISYGQVLGERGNNLFTGAFTLKYLVPLSAAFINIEKLDYIVPNANLLVINEITGSYGHTGFDGEADIGSQLFSSKGYGFGIDLGITIFNKRLERAYACGTKGNDLKKYKYKLGVSVLDLGWAHLGKKAQVFSYNKASVNWLGIDTAKFDNLIDFDSTLSNRFLNNPNQSFNKNGFDVILPSAISIQFDYCIAPRLYINASLIQRIPFGKIRVLRPNQLSITPRYELRSFEVAIPFSMFDYTQPRFGLAFRYKFFTLGTDKVGSFTGLWDISGVDIYAGFKFMVCNNKSKIKKAGDCFAY